MFQPIRGLVDFDATLRITTGIETFVEDGELVTSLNLEGAQGNHIGMAIAVANRRGTSIAVHEVASAILFTTRARTVPPGNFLDAPDSVIRHTRKVTPESRFAGRLEARVFVAGRPLVMVGIDALTRITNETPIQGIMAARHAIHFFIVEATAMFFIGAEPIAEIAFSPIRAALLVHPIVASRAIACVWGVATSQTTVDIRGERDDAAAPPAVVLSRTTGVARQNPVLVIV